MSEKKESFHFKKWFNSGKVNKKLTIILFMIIPVALLVLFTYVPFLKMFEFSFYKMKYIGARKYVGLQNYIDVFQRDDCFKALTLSLYYMLGAVVQLALGLYFATVLTSKVKGSGLFKGLMFFPYLVCGIALGYIFKFFYTRGYVFDTVLQLLGMDLDNLPYWLQDTRVNNICLVATSVWKYMGQNMVLFIGAIMSVDSSLYEAAAIDGANAWSKFRYIILPSIKTIIVLTLILAITGSLSAFEPPYVITNGTFGTSTYFVIMHKLAHEHNKVGLASAMAIVLLVIIIIATLIQKGVEKALTDDGDVSMKTRRRLQKMKSQGE